MFIGSRRIILNLVLALCMIVPGASLASAQTSESTDVLIWTANENDLAVFEICYELEGYSNVGCDENRDGNVSFADIPYGTYTVVASYPNGSDYRVEPFQINVDAANSEFLAHAVNQHQENPAEGVVDVLLLTRDPETGESLTDVCFELVGYSNIGCDENNDGRVSFADIPYGTYTIRQTSTPGGYEVMGDYEVEIFHLPHTGPFTILLAQAETQAPDQHTNYSVVFYDASTGELVENAENCAEFAIGGQGPISAIGCDEDIVDGQIDFMAVNVTQQGWSSHHELNVFPACGFQVHDITFKIVGDATVIWMVALTPAGKPC